MSHKIDPKISLKQISVWNLFTLVRLSVHEKQKRFVASNAMSLFQAAFHRKSVWLRLILLADIPIGFVMLHNNQGRVWIWRFMIDKHFQGRGYGRESMNMIVALARDLSPDKELYLSCIDDRDGPKPFYEKLGFRANGEFLGREVVLVLDHHSLVPTKEN